MTAGGSINIDVMHWHQLADIYDYAAEHAIPLEIAVQQLVNTGLAAQRPWQQRSR